MKQKRTFYKGNKADKCLKIHTQNKMETLLAAISFETIKQD